MNKKIFITFGGPTKNYHDAVSRLCDQARSFFIFDKIIGYTDKDLEKYDDFYNRHNEFLKNNVRGYGYWIWKPYLILKTLNEMNPGDVIMYCDAGCELNLKQKSKLIRLLEKTKKFSILAGSASYNELKYAKMDLVNFLGMQERSDILRESQWAATVIISIKNEDTLKLFNNFYEICSNNYRLLDDSPSQAKNHHDFIENRHDQSVFSLLLKKSQLKIYNINTYDLTNFSWLSNNPIWAIRNRSGISLMGKYRYYKINSKIKKIMGNGGQIFRKYLPGLYSVIKKYYISFLNDFKK